MNMIDVLGFI